MELDSLFVSLSLDPAKFQKGTKEGIESLRKFRTDAKAAADDTERSAGKMADGFTRVTKEVLGLGLAIAGASSLKSLVVGTVQAADSVNLLSRAMGLNEAITSKWVNTARRAGIDTGAAQGAFRSLTAAAGAVMAQVPGAQGAIGAPFLQALGIENPQFNDPDKLAAQIVKGFQQSEKSPGELLAISQHIPGGEMFLQIAKEFKTVEALNKALADSVTTTHDQAEAARKLVTAMTDLQLAIEKKLNELIPVAAPTANQLIKGGKQLVEGDASGLLTIDQALGGDQTVAAQKSLWDAFIRVVMKPGAANKWLSDSNFIGPPNFQGPFQPMMSPETRNVPPEGMKGGDRFPGLGPAQNILNRYQGWASAGNAPVDISRTFNIGSMHFTLPPGTKDPQDFVDRFNAAIHSTNGFR